MATLKLHGHEYYYEDHGPKDAPCIVLSPLVYTDTTVYEPIARILADDYRVITYDHRGLGRSEHTVSPSLESGAKDVAALIEQLGVGPCHFVGNCLGAYIGLQLAIRHPEKVNKLIGASVAYDVRGWQPEFREFIPQMTVAGMLALPWFKEKADKDPRFPELVARLIQLEKEPMAWEADVKALKTPVLIITGDADVSTLDHSVEMFHLLGGGMMGDMGKPLAASRLAVLPATAHTAVITQVDLLLGFINPFLEGTTPKGIFE